MAPTYTICRNTHTYIYIYACTHICIDATQHRVCMSIDMYMHMCIHIGMYVCMYVCVHMYICLRLMYHYEKLSHRLHNSMLLHPAVIKTLSRAPIGQQDLLETVLLCTMHGG